MKKSLFLLLMFIMLLSACNPLAKDDSSQSKLEREDNPQVTPAQLQALVVGNNHFAFDFYRQINTGDDNLIFSPISLSLALSMTLSGARGDTRDEMLQALSLTSLGEELHPAFNALLQAIENSEVSMPPADETGSPFNLNIANGIWGRAVLPLNRIFWMNWQSITALGSTKLITSRMLLPLVMQSTVDCK